MRRRKQQSYLVTDESVLVEKFIPGGQALGQLSSGKKVFFWGALPGEIVTEFQVTLEKTSYLEAIALKIDQPSAQRIAPRDNCYLATSPWQILKYDYELTEKHALLVEIFRQAGLKNLPEILPVQTDGQDFFYRNKMEYGLFFDHEDQKLYPSFNQRGTHRKIKITKSSLERPEIFQAATKILDDLTARQIDGRKFQSILLRANQSGQVSGGLLEKNHPHPTFENLTDDLLGQTYSYSPNGFFQINLPVYELVLQEISQHIKTDKVLDLYSGVGTIGLSIIKNADIKELTLVEINKQAYGELEKNCQNAAQNHDVSIKPVLSESENALEYIAPDQTVILDPPRAGCDGKLITKLLEVSPQTIIYLSCNPATQARDLVLLSEKYTITKIQPYNFFPRTPHLENLVVLQLS